jgi:hypothetical protein
MKSLMMATVSLLVLTIVLTCTAKTTAAVVAETFSGPGVCGAFSYDSNCPSSNCAAATKICHFVFHSKDEHVDLSHGFYYKNSSGCGQNMANEYFEIIMYTGSTATFTLQTNTNLGACKLVLTYKSNPQYPPTYGTLPTTLIQSDFTLMQLTIPSGKTYNLNSLSAGTQAACTCMPSMMMTCPPQPVCAPVYYCPPAPCVRFVRQPLWARFGACQLFRRCW